MCGIFGVLKLNSTGVDIQRLQNAVNIIRHRGPDDEGYALIDTGTGTMQECFGDTSQIKKGSHILSAAGNTSDLALGFRRLSILDLSSNGHQPFTNSDKSVCLIFNGEIYNYIEIREELLAKG